MISFTNSLNSDGMNLDCTFSELIIPCLEFSIEFQSNQLIYQKEYTKRQQVIYVVILHLHDREGWGYRKISQWLNQSGIKTHRGKKWFSSSVISVLKEKTRTWPKDSTDKKPTFPHQNLKVRGQLLYFWLNW